VPDLLPEQCISNEKAIKEGGCAIFDPNISLTDNLEDGFYVFTLPEPPSNEPTRQTFSQPEPNTLEEEATAYICGCHYVNLDSDIITGGGAWFDVDDPRTSGKMV